ncbi:type I DNA topoisomerase [Candidatus Saccharibacteria bacterium]|nr:type I DNA topoisomerase [Candidatus Saccharibacteria bacterium]
MSTSAKKNLVIVESPAKAKTIEKYLGSDFKVLSSVGHIRSIPKKAKDGGQAIDIKNGFKTEYEVDPEKKKVITELKKAVKDATTVWLATDEDREGEAIAWHLCEVLKLDPKTTNRIVFHEITKDAITEAVQNPRTVDMNLVQAQQARQILDRIVGFELSPVVWQKVPGGKSAGRVQSPAVKLLVEREREIEAFEGSFQFKVTAEFKHGSETFKAELPKRFDTEKEASKFLESLKDADFTVSDVTKSPGTRNPGAPYTTSSLQQDANSRLGFGSKATMGAAQKLYQDGKITYMRTDSVNLSKQSLAQMTSYIKKQFGEDYHQFRTFKTKNSSAQEAHEAIRPTDVSLEVASSDTYNQKLYDLIRRRTLASQMAPAKLEKTTITITISTAKEVFEAKGEVVIFDGFLKVYGASKKDPEILPPLAASDTLKLRLAQARQTFARPPARYTEGSLVKKLEELGIGRPSTYATIINTVQVRGYAERGESEGEPREVIVLSTKGTSVERVVEEEKTGSNKGKLVPTASGQVVSDFLSNHFDPVIDYGFTARVEEEFDEVAEGKLKRNDMLQEFYDPFHKLIEKSGDIDRSKVAQAREIGKHPKSGKPILARFGRYGPMLQLGDTEDEEKPQFAPLPKGAKLETVTIEEALKAFELPRVVGQTDEGQDIKANIGRFGPYIQVEKLFVSIKPLDPHTITLKEAKELYAAKLKAEAEKNIADFGGGLKVLNGRFGPYVTDGKKNAKVPKDTDPKSITEEQAKQMIAEAPEKKGFRGRKAPAKKTTRKPSTKKKS